MHRNTFPIKLMKLVTFVYGKLTPFSLLSILGINKIILRNDKTLSCQCLPFQLLTF